MIRPLVWLLLVLPIMLSAQSDIDKQISETSQQISTFDKKYNTLNSKMAQNARAILQQKQTILLQQKRLEELMFELSLKEESYQNNVGELKQIHNLQSSLTNEQNEIEQKLVFALARNVSLSMLINDKRAVNADAVITEVILKKMTQQIQEEITGLNQTFEKNSKRIAALELRIITLEGVIASIESKRSELDTTQKENKKALAMLEEDKKRYKASIDHLLKKQKSLKTTLSKLNIIKEEKAKRHTSHSRTVVAAKNLPKVKQRGSSYQKIQTKRYRGKKTIPPIDGYELVKKFGPYVDPIYNIKIFNESVSLKPKEANAKVKNVLNGKVILAQNTLLLDNIVIVEHADGMHTIYANLDKIAPTVKKGKKIRKGSVIGRVSNELMFEVTQKKYHIDPMQLIN